MTLKNQYKGTAILPPGVSHWLKKGSRPVRDSYDVCQEDHLMTTNSVPMITTHDQQGKWLTLVSWMLNHRVHLYFHTLTCAHSHSTTHMNFTTHYSIICNTDNNWSTTQKHLWSETILACSELSSDVPGLDMHFLKHLSDIFWNQQLHKNNSISTLDCKVSTSTFNLFTMTTIRNGLFGNDADFSIFKWLFSCSIGILPILFSDMNIINIIFCVAHTDI